ncbi:MAG: hypothetical protein A2430_02885 [Candidatus Liptonbacteria bacterium RIFOXYC1_FULL_36_8]|uniref:Methyltransferase type 11 domain-containing protein n=2 Tax=Candidatus Liptoniibacteriota TaxID=1817909 RepID=A0A1G2CR65_9BACT|nr:MAG: hypothetical protein A2390_01540 [Candidatus Liptonbacteria bacterium RIFOXYB1_FULL_36_10]OGZ03347.1 MAG: hypothetical protein A2430_02885 [Candidatus Liptonbacteria bacterium RIFOXYC1_FULL_36_8]
MEDKNLACEEIVFGSESELGNKNPQVLKIEKIALWSNRGKYFNPIVRTDSGPVIFMTFYQEDLRVSFKDIWADLEKKFPGETLLIADIGCYKGGAIREAINYFISFDQEQYAFFGIDILSAENIVIPGQRYIRGNIRDLSIIPDNTFHYLFSSDSLFYVLGNIDLALKEIYRILKPGGIAHFSILGWHLAENKIRNAGLDEFLHLTLVHASAFPYVGNYGNKLKLPTDRFYILFDEKFKDFFFDPDKLKFNFLAKERLKSLANNKKREILLSYDNRFEILK